MSNGHIEVERARPGTVWITIDNRAKFNAMSLAMWRELDAAVAQLEDDPEVRVVVVRGAGGRAFVSGADISEFSTLRASSDISREYDAAAGRAIARLRGLPVPTIAMIEGICIGGGVLLALCCDLRYAAENASFSIPAARVGLGYTWPAVKDLMDAVGASAAKEMLFAANSYAAPEALAMGLINRVVAPDALLAFTETLAARIADNAPLTIRAAKRAVAELLKIGGRPDTALCDEMTARCLDSADYREGYESFLAKRKPVFRGR